MWKGRTDPEQIAAKLQQIEALLVRGVSRRPVLCMMLTVSFILFTLISSSDSSAAVTQARHRSGFYRARRGGAQARHSLGTDLERMDRQTLRDWVIPFNE